MDMLFNFENKTASNSEKLALTFSPTVSYVLKVKEENGLASESREQYQIEIIKTSETENDNELNNAPSTIQIPELTCGEEYLYGPYSPYYLGISQTEASLFQCLLCQKQYDRRKGLMRHIYVHMRKDYSCPICLKKYAHQSQLENHNMNHHSSTTLFQCSVCKKEFGHLSACSSHMKTHSDK